MAKIGQSVDKPAPQFWILTAFLIVVFLTGGASRVDVQSLPILRPFSVLMCAIALMSLRVHHLEGRRSLFAAFAIALVLSLSHVIPLPPSIWQALPGRGELTAVDNLTGLKDQWRPLTIAPANGWHAFASLFTPLAVLLLGVQLGREDLRRLLPLVIALGAVSGLVGLLQVISDPQGPLYFYRITNNGSAVGLFSNRNHAATLLACLFPLLAVYASMATGTEDQIRARQLVSASVAIVLVPLILVTGSRSGLVSSVIGLAAASLIYRRPADRRKVRRGDGRKSIGAVPVLGGIAAISLGFLTFFFSRAVAIDRLFEEASHVSRADYWRVSLDLFSKYLPWGSGSGSFVEAFLIAEPNNILIAVYANRAHNDFLETAITFGLPGLLFLASSVVLLVLQGFRVWTVTQGSLGSVALARAASAAILIVAIASLSDYPLRTPTMMSLFALWLLWFFNLRSEHDQMSYRQERGA